jgi:hypothetical protein
MLRIVYFVQQNSVNSTSYNSGILIIWHLKRVVPRLEMLLFSRKKLCQTGRSQGHVQNELQVCASNVVISRDPLSSIKFFSYEDARKHERGT